MSNRQRWHSGRVTWHGIIALLTPLCLLPMCTAAADDVAVERRQRLEQMSVEQREHLTQNYHRFLQLDPQNQAELRALQAAVEQDPDREQLRQVMRNYHEWLNELPASQRMSLAALPAEERMKRIDEIRTMQGKRNRLSPPDMKVFEAWMAKHELQKKFFETRRMPELTAEQLAELRDQLSDEPKKSLTDAKTADDQRRLMFAWIAQLRRPWSGGGSRGAGRRPSDEELLGLLKSELTDEERSYLRGLPPEQMQRELHRLWRERHPRSSGDRSFAPEGRGFPSGRRGSGAPPTESP